MKPIKKLNQAELADFCSELALLLPAGITPYDAILLMRQDNTSKQSGTLLSQLQFSLESGMTLEGALRATEAFPEYMTGMVLLGEQSGNLDLIMRRLASYYEQQCSIRDSVKSAVSYPLIMIVLMLLILIVLLTKVMPIFQQVFVQLGSELSPISMRLMSLGTILRNVSIIILALFLLAGAGFFVLSRHPEGRRRLTAFLHQCRFTRNYYLGIAYSRLASALSLISAGGIDIYEGLRLAQKLVAHDTLCSQIDVCREHLERGDDLPAAMKGAAIFDAKQLRMLQVGYKSGSTDAVFERISRHYEEMTLSRLQRIVGAIEPTLVIIFSLMVGLILLSVMMPLIGIMSSIG